MQYKSSNETFLERPYSHFFHSHCHILDNKIKTFENKSIVLQNQHFHLFHHYDVEGFDMNACMHRVCYMATVVFCKNIFPFLHGSSDLHPHAVNSSTSFGTK